MRVLWLSPWLRPLARVQAEALIDRGHQVLLVTSDQHPEPVTVRPYELVLDPRPKTPATWPQFAHADRQIRHFGAQVVIAELVRDPRWLAFGRGLPRVSVQHDDRPHDVAEQRPGWERAVFDRWAARSAATVAFSDYVARELGGAVEVLPLTSDLPDSAGPDSDLPDSAGPAGNRSERRDFVVFGRLNPYKNLAVTFAAWQAHVAGPAYRGDQLLLIGSGALPGELPPHSRRLEGDFSYAEVLPVLARAKASLVHYRQASQSGVQVLSMQLGLTPIVSPVGALAEFQPPGEVPVGVDDVTGLRAALDSLAVPEQAAARGAAARAHYLARFSQAAAAARWEQVLQQVRPTQG